MGGRLVTQADRARLDALSGLGCIVCLREGLGWSQPAIHHLKRNPETGEHLGMSQRASHAHTIPLCPLHHQHGGFGVAYHAGPREFERLHGTETELWRHTNALLEIAA